MKTRNSKNTVQFICLLGLLLLTSGMNAQQVFDLKGAGARAAGMGYAFIGVADDATASSWNPGGLTQIDNVDISVVTDYSFNDQLKYSYEKSGNEYTSNIQPKLTLNYASLVLPFKVGDDKQFNLGLSVQNYINYKWTYEEENLEKYYYDTRYNNTMIYAATVSAAYTLTNVMSVGVAANYYFSQGNEWGGTYYNDPESNYVNTVDGYGGINFNLGVLFDFEESSANMPLKLGARLSTPFELETDGSPEIYNYGSFTDGYEMPMVAGLGASYRIGDNFTLSFDYDVRFLKDCHSYWYGTKYDINSQANTNLPEEKVNLLYEEKEDALTEIVPTNENITQIRLGAEYNIPLGDSFVMPIRAGYKTGSTTAANYDEDGEPTDLAKGSSIHFGIGFSHIDLFSFDIGYVNYNYTKTNDESAYTMDAPVSNLVASLIIYLGRKGSSSEGSDMDY